jgi:hypothetical protein
VQQKGIDVVVSLFSPSGEKLREVDSPHVYLDAERLSYVINETGSYQIEVKSPSKRDVPGKYQVRIEQFRIASQQDKDLIESERLYDEMITLFTNNELDQAISLIKQ